MGCDKTSKDFYSPNCFEYHQMLCDKPIEICETCNRKIFNEDHDCNAWGTCNNCQETFTTQDLRDVHRCYFQKTIGMHEPIKTIKGRTTWSSHWSYDFETYRESEEGEEVYKHQVLAWSIELKKPTEEVLDFINEHKIIEKYENLVSVTNISFMRVDQHFRFYGKDMKSFLRCCELLTVSKGYLKTIPTFWAYNGARFDGKFIMDYYLNVMKMDLSGASYEETEENEWVKTKYKPKKSVLQLVMVGTRALKIKVRNMKFGCALAHLGGGLRGLPEMLGLDSQVAKGEFPYGRMKLENWGKILPYPTLDEFDLDSKTEGRRNEIIEWYNQQDTTQGWDFDKELWKYLFADVHVLSEGLAAYDSKAKEMQERLKTEELNGYVSPLDFATAPSWALAIYRTWFLPEENIATLKPSEEKFIRESLHGGRTDKRCNWFKTDYENPMDYVDFTSLYPSVQKTNVHGTYYPTGIPYWLRQETMKTNNKEILAFMNGIDPDTKKSRCGYLRVTTKHLKYTTHPTLQYLGSWDDNEKDQKLLFPNADMSMQVYGWPEIEEAILSGEIEVLEINEALIFERGEVFDKYVDFFFDVKDQAEVDGNEGLRSLAKLLLNSLWGKLGQRSYPVKEWISDSARRQYLWDKFDNKEYELVGIACKDDSRTHVTYRIPDDYSNLTNTACQLAAYVSMWGRVILHKKILNPFGDRALYCDTDSGIIFPKKGIAIPYMGRGLGMLVSEIPKMIKKAKLIDFPNPRLIESVQVVPKTYGIKIQSSNGKEYTKVVCKGFEVSYANAKSVTFEAMKNLVFTQYKINPWLNGKRMIEEEVEEIYRIPGAKRLTFRSSMANGEIAPREAYVEKGMRGIYTKGKVHPYDPRFIIPYGKFKPPKEMFLD